MLPMRQLQIDIGVQGISASLVTLLRPLRPELKSNLPWWNRRWHGALGPTILSAIRIANPGCSLVIHTGSTITWSKDGRYLMARERKGQWASSLDDPSRLLSCQCFRKARYHDRYQTVCRLCWASFRQENQCPGAHRCYL